MECAYYFDFCRLCRQPFVSSIDCRDFLLHPNFLLEACWKTPIPKSECCYTTLDTFLN